MEILIALAALGGLTLPLAPSSMNDVLDPEVRAALPKLKELMITGIETKEPQVGIPHTAELDTVFDGSFDYHSCVMAHWALCVMARVDEDTELEKWLMERLSNDVIKKEHENLVGLEKEPWTFPYEHAWMAMLLSELAKRDSLDQKIVEAFRLDVEKKLLEGLEENDFPENIPPESSGGTVYNGFYKSWQMGFWLLQLSDPITEGASERIEKLRTEKLEPNREAIRTHDKVFGFDFLYIPAMIALIDRTAPEGVKIPESPYSPDPVPELPEKVTLGTVHVLGIEISRVWPSAIDARQGSEEARAAFNGRVKEFLARGDLWSDDFTVVAHWMPQYIYIGVWLAEGRP